MPSTHPPSASDAASPLAGGATPAFVLDIDLDRLEHLGEAWAPGRAPDDAGETGWRTQPAVHFLLGGLPQRH